jgi:hypothetical protein
VALSISFVMPNNKRYLCEEQPNTTTHDETRKR